jgi:NhaP-type Na+/H+ or K+/H+ antiporter
MSAHITASLVAIGLLGVAAQWAAWRLRQPAILLLLIGGLAAGPGLGWLDPDALLGELLFPFISLAVAVILDWSLDLF